MKLKAYIILFFSLFFTFSCELEEEVFDRIAPETAFETEADAQAAIMGAYYDLSTYGVFKDYLSGLELAASDAIIYTRSGGDRGLLSRKLLNSSSVHNWRTWAGMYNIINNSYLVLERVPDIQMNEETKTRILGEAHFLIGYAHFNLVRRYGRAPIKVRATLDDSDLNTPLATKEQLYQTVIEHLELAEQMCALKSDQPISERGRATKGAAQAMLADAYLNMEDWSNAEIYADKVINSGEYTLLPNYADLWDVEKEDIAEATEVIFAIQFKRDPSNAGFSALGNSTVFRVNPNRAANRTGDPTGRGSNEFAVQPWFYDICTTGEYENDYRGEVSFLTEFPNRWNGSIEYTYPNTDIVHNQNKYPFTNKYKDPQGLDNLNNENDFFIYRMSEIYLIKAEAANELGKASEAYTAFNKLRERARLANGTIRTTPADLTTGLGKDDFRHAIFTERGVELNYEMKRWYDLVRMKRGGGETYFDYMYNVFIPSLPNGKKYMATLVYDPTYKLFPIPTNEISSNSSISFDEQNPGY